MDNDDNKVMVPLLRFEPFTSTFSTTFWKRLGQLKIDQIKLDHQGAPLPIWGTYQPGTKATTTTTTIEGTTIPLTSPLLYFDHESLLPSLPDQSGPLTVHGSIRLFDTIESFRSFDKTALSRQREAEMRAALFEGEDDRAFSLHRFDGLVFADLKKYRFYYHFAHPVLAPSKEAGMFEVVSRLQDGLSPGLYDCLWRQRPTLSEDSYFCLKTTTTTTTIDDCSILPLNWENAVKPGMTFVHLDASNWHPEGPTADWTVRQFLMALTVQLQKTTSSYGNSMGVVDADPMRFVVDLILLRDSPGASERLTIRLPRITGNEDVVLVGGWERNAAASGGKIAPSMLDLAPLLDPLQYVKQCGRLSIIFCRIAREASELNLKLIKWRLLPELDLERIWQQGCLLIGAGTLGCNVARCLLGWGIRRISFVDNGRIAFSNPVRQSLFRHGDCVGDVGEEAYKAVVAAQRLREIDPSCEARGHVLSIPMPGHNLGEGWREELGRLEELILQHNVIFLLTDSRESRWLPALLGAVHERVVITAALGFDSWMVMRHGRGVPRHLSCYFCSDNVGPRDSLSNRTLDQQCTVSRPGASYMAAATAVELLASLLQHPMGAAAPASVVPKDQILSFGSGESVLGAVPHQIRGFMGPFQVIHLTGEPYSGCIACSPSICQAYREGGAEFVRTAIETPDWMWSITEPTRKDVDGLEEEELSSLFEACEEFE